MKRDPRLFAPPNEKRTNTNKIKTLLASVDSGGRQTDDSPRDAEVKKTKEKNTKTNREAPDDDIISWV